MKLLTIRFIVLLTTLIFVVNSYSIIYAQPPITLPPSPTDPKFSSAGLPTKIIFEFFTPIVFILGFIALYYMVLASIRLIISKGDPEKVAEARSRLIYAVVGFIVLLLAYASLQFIEQVFLKTFISR